MANIWVQGRDDKVLHQQTLACILAVDVCEQLSLYPSTLSKGEGWLFSFYLL